MHVLLELLVVSARVALSFAVAALRWLRPRAPKSVLHEVCLVTGAARGLGRLFALELATRGVDTLVLWDVDGEGNEETAALARGAAAGMVPSRLSADAGVACPRVLAYTCDVSKRVDVYRVAGLVRRDAGDVTLLVNNAGVVSGRPLLDCPDELLERTMAVNLHALFWVS
uniref:Retinol dehydrogenase 10 n=1 Tax=Petromyzon marinus TaxID=7757 RepID=S4RW07_PETMA